MKFSEWLKQFIGQQSAIGDLARDVLRDRTAPALNSRQEWRLHLDSRNACDGALDAFELAWKRYAAEVKRSASGF